LIKLSAQNGLIRISAQGDVLAARHGNQLAYWGFRPDADASTLICNPEHLPALLGKVVRYLTSQNLPCDLDEHVQLLLTETDAAYSELQEAAENGRHFKDGELPEDRVQEIRDFLMATIPRTLKVHQLKAVLHLLYTRNGANFSVPGSGKTTVVLAVFHRLRHLGEVDALFVVGPPACFGPWRTEYQATLGREPTCEVLAGGDVDTRRNKYLVNKQTSCDLYLTSFQTLQRDWERVRVLFTQQGIRFYFVVDEAHYIKQIDGAWANAVLNVAPHAARRCILTGSPFPRHFCDAFNLFDVLWPRVSPIPPNARRQIELHIARNELNQAATILDDAIGPLFYRVRKRDLGLAPQVFHDPVYVQMRPYERRLYDAILGRIRHLAELDSLKTVDLLYCLRRGRMIRLRQCVSYAGLLGSAVDDYTEQLSEPDLPLSGVISRYDELERPGKLDALLTLVHSLRKQAGKIVIWSNFVRTLKLIRDTMSLSGYGVRLIYGGTPVHETTVRDELTREVIIQEFCEPESGVEILVANPAACAESISLHKACSHAIYYDLSYNCAQYIQSLDRIHRVGGSEHTPSHYYVLQYEDTIDGDILANVQHKAAIMGTVIDKDYAVYSLDMFADDEDQDAYERLFGRLAE